MIVNTLRADSLPFVAFVGAGASMIPPSCLPSWTGFNTMLLECLCERLDDYSRRRQPTAQMLKAFKARRDGERLLAPDFQAQLIEDEIGDDYFAVWQSIECAVFGPVHAALAELADRSLLTAIITTNFDRLIELAFEACGVPCEVHHDGAGFERLVASLDGDIDVGTATRRPVPIVKIHGSIEDTASLVDTLRQRMSGRPPALNRALQALLVRAPWVFLGWSGADLNHNPRYLGLLDATDTASGLVFTRRVGDPLEPGVQAVVAAYRRAGAGKAETIEVDATTWLQETFGLPAWVTTPGDAAGRSQVEADVEVKRMMHVWVDGLGPIAVVNMMCAMLKSAGLDHESWWLLRRTFESYRTPDDTSLVSYRRYNYNYGVALLETGFIRNPCTLAEDWSNMAEWKTHADQNGFEFLSRAYQQGGLLPAGGALAALLAYRGEVGKAIVVAQSATDAAIRREAWIDLCDIAIDSQVICDIVQIFRPAVVQGEQCLEHAIAFGDEPRRALLSAHLGRLYTCINEFEPADRHLQAAEHITAALGLPKAARLTRAARGLWLYESGASRDKGFEVLRALAEEIRTEETTPLVTKVDLAAPSSEPLVLTGRQPMLCRVLLDLGSVALARGDGRTVHHVLGQLEEITVEHFNGYLPHYHFLYARALLLSDPPDPERARTLLAKAREVGILSGNPWVAQYADHLQPHVEAALDKLGR